MDLLLVCLVVSITNSIMFLAYQQKAFFINLCFSLYTEMWVKNGSSHNQLVIEKTKNGASSSVKNVFTIMNKNSKMLEVKRLHDLRIEKSQLKSKLKTLEFITNFEMYLNENHIDVEKFNQFKEFSDLKLLTQQGVLESTKRVSGLSAA
ncbi:hypothetical protein [Mariniflexile sp. AS56]|uniref:hypothetical protein n=1 Tax=Mariniflexile sp. AS56 TaxID=3063957 RepID=UPI0026F1F6CA|nr:hypothetical protein [Mariniflexile sp. AS56]MDO7172683.1 hypothetical protein [Mariniflexile sp. AS56]